MQTELVLIAISAVILLSYLFDLFSHKTRLSPVLLLILTGLGLRQLSDWTGMRIPYLNYALPPLGTIGLILIVLEAGLDLELHSEKKELIGRSFLSALAGLLLCLAALTAVLLMLFGAPLRTCLVNALPFSIISSAIAIPGSRLLGGERSEFVTYESSFSDILGILLFNFVLLNEVLALGPLLNFGLEIAATVLVSFLFSLALAALLARLRHQVKYLPVFAALMLVYACAKLLHFSPLILVLVFGLFLNNLGLFVRGRLGALFPLERAGAEVRQFKNVIAEITFVIKTFFFLLLGYSVNIPGLFSREAAAVALPLLLALYASRALPLRALLPARRAAALTYVAPRGLITILLFMGIPPALRLGDLPESALLWIIFLSSAVMAWGVAKHARDQDPGAAAPASAPPA